MTITEHPEREPEPYYPDLGDVIHAEDVNTKGGSGFAATYVNWSRTATKLREHAPGWMPEAVPSPSGEMSHEAPDGSRYLMIRFVHHDGRATLPVPHAIMDHKNNPIAGDAVDARDISDAFVRGMCKSAALAFGLGWKLWSKDDPLEREAPPPKPSRKPQPKPVELEPFATIEHALAALPRVNSPGALKAWAAQTAHFTGDDRIAIREAGAERKAELQAEEANPLA